MRRARITAPAELLDQIDELAAEQGFKKPYFIGLVLKAGMDAIRANPIPPPVIAPAVPPAPAPTPAAAAPSALAKVVPAAPPAEPADKVPSLVHTFKRGDTRWYDMREVCHFVSISMADLAQDLDPEDDIIKYIGKEWVDMRGLRTACSLTTDRDSATRLTEWANTLEN